MSQANESQRPCHFATYALVHLDYIFFAVQIKDIDRRHDKKYHTILCTVSHTMLRSMYSSSRDYAKPNGTLTVTAPALVFTVAFSCSKYPRIDFISSKVPLRYTPTQAEGGSDKTQAPAKQEGHDPCNRTNTHARHAYVRTHTPDNIPRRVKVQPRQRYHHLRNKGVIHTVVMASNTSFWLKQNTGKASTSPSENLSTNNPYPRITQGTNKTETRRARSSTRHTRHRAHTYTHICTPLHDSSRPLSQHRPESAPPLPFPFP